MARRPHQPSILTRRTLVATACVLAAVGLAAPLAGARTVEFTSGPPASVDTQVSSPFAPGAQPASLGVKADSVSFSLNRADRRALSAARDAERLRARGTAATASATLASERIAAIEELLVAAERDEQRLRTAIAERAVAQYKGGEQGALSFLLSGGGLGDVLARGRTLRDASARDRQLAQDHQVTVERLEQLQEVLGELRDLQGERAVSLGERATRLDSQLVSARTAHDEAPPAEPDAAAGATAAPSGTWYVMDGAFEASFFLPTSSGSYDGGTRTPRRAASGAQIAAVLGDSRIVLDASGYNDIATGQIDGRLLDALRGAAERFGGVKVTSLKSDHGVYTANGNLSAHSFGCAADIGTIGSTYITGASQTPGSEVEQAVRYFASLGGDLAPHQVISLFDLGGSTMRLGDHDDHIHLGYAC